MLRLLTRLRIQSIGVAKRLKGVRVATPRAPAKTSIRAARTTASSRQSEETARILLIAPMVEKLSALQIIQRYGRAGRSLIRTARPAEPRAFLRGSPGAGRSGAWCV